MSINNYESFKDNIAMLQKIVAGDKIMLKLKGIIIFYITVFVFNLFSLDLFTVLAAYEKTNEMGKVLPEECIERPYIQYNGENFRDPFQSSITKEEEISSAVSPETSEKTAIISESSLPPLTVQGIVWGGTFPQAIINNKVVKIGDTIKTAIESEEISIIGIDKDGITVSFQNIQYKLSSPAAVGYFSQTP